MNTDQRPWGSYQVLLKEDGFQVKRIEVKPKLRFSLQKHHRRAEKWVVTSGEGVVQLDDRQIPVKRGSVVEVGLGQIHRMTNTGEAPLVFVEVQLGDYFGEDDIVRLEDDFSRK